MPSLKYQQRKKVRNQALQTLRVARIKYCLYGREVVSKYGVPLVMDDKYYAHVQVAVVDHQLQDAHVALKRADFLDDKDHRWVVASDESTIKGIFVISNSVHVELLAASSHCEFPPGTFDRVVTTNIGSAVHLPSLQDCLVALSLSTTEPREPDLGSVFASMLVDVYRLDEDWIVSNLSALNQDVCQDLIRKIAGQKRAFMKAKPTGWILHKFFTNGHPLNKPLYQAKNGCAVSDWPPPRRSDWVIDDPRAGDCLGNEGETEEGEGGQKGLFRRLKGDKGSDPTGGGGDHGKEDTGSDGKKDEGREEGKDDEGDENKGGEDGDDDGDDLPNELLLKAARRCLEVLEQRSCGPVAFAGGFAIQRMGHQRRTTGFQKNIDFVCENFGRCMKALQKEDDFHFPNKMATGAFQAFCKLTSSEGTGVVVTLNGLNAGEFGPYKLAKKTLIVDGDIPVLNWTELLRIKVKSYAARYAPKDLGDIKLILKEHSDALSDERLEDVIWANLESFPTDVQDMLTNLLGA